MFYKLQHHLPNYLNMRKFIPFILCLFLSMVTFAQTGVDFQHLTFDEALAKAKAENKLVFVDCYTTWCGPCKHMTNEVFPQPAAGEYFNPRFVCVKYDMEKEGKELGKKLGVRAYPSFFIIRPDGTVQHTIVGGGDLESFIKRVELGLNEKTSLLYLDQQYDKGKMKKKELMAYVNALNDAYNQKKAKEVEGKLKSMLSEKDRLKAEYWPLLESTKMGTPDFQFILDHLAVLEKNVGKEKIDKYLKNAFVRQLGTYLNGRGGELSALQEMKQQIEKLNIADKEFLLKQCGMAEAVLTGKPAMLIELIENNLSSFSGDNAWTAISALGGVQAKASKEELNRMAALVEKMMQDPKNEKSKDFMQSYVDHFKKSGHVGVYFEDLTFEQALEKEKQQRKMLFIDCYTSWCGPCKYMTTTIFPKEEMGDFMNKNFVCVKYDMEKGEGPELAKKFGVRAFPTFIMLKPDGSLQHRMVGGGEAEQFIERVKEGMDDTKAFGPLQAKYDAGNRDKAFLANYANALISTYSADAGKVARELYQSLSDDEKVNETYWFLFENPELAPEGSEAANYLLANRERFNQTIGKEKIDQRLSAGYQQKLMAILFGRDSKTTAKELDQMKKEVIALKFDNQKSLIATINIAKAKLSGNADRLLAACEKEVSQMPAEDFPYTYIVYGAQAKATPAQMSRWIKLGKKLVANCQNEEYAKRLEGFVQNLEEKK